MYIKDPTQAFECILFWCKIQFIAWGWLKQYFQYLEGTCWRFHKIEWFGGGGRRGVLSLSVHFVWRCKLQQSVWSCNSNGLCLVIRSSRLDKSAWRLWSAKTSTVTASSPYYETLLLVFMISLLPFACITSHNIIGPHGSLGGTKTAVTRWDL